MFFVNLPPLRVHVPGLPKNEDQATRRPNGSSYPHTVWGREDQKVLLHKYARKVDHAISTALAGQTTPLVLAADEPLASYQYLIEDTIEGNLDGLRC